MGVVKRLTNFMGKIKRGMLRDRSAHDKAADKGKQFIPEKPAELPTKRIRQTRPTAKRRDGRKAKRRRQNQRRMHRIAACRPTY